MQIRATKLVSSIKHLNYEKRLKKLKIPTLKYRRMRGDLIEVHKIINNNNIDVDCTLNLHQGLGTTRGNRYKLHQGQVKYNLRIYFFTDRVTQRWNSLPDEVVGANNINIFKRKLDDYACSEVFL
jgi:hypothetical protein